MDQQRSHEIEPSLRRYAKQVRFPGIGIEGQKRLAGGRALIIGCGALGTVVASTLARAGVGSISIVDRDFIELDNLQRQVLYDEADVGMPKAIVAAERLQKINSTIQITPHLADVDFRNIEGLISAPRPADVVVDGTDNFETRFLINDACVKLGVPWVYGGCLGCDGQTMTILPRKSACLNCLMLDGPPPPGTTATCDTGGILASIIGVVASVQSLEAIKIISGQLDSVSRYLQVFDLWGNRIKQMDVVHLREQVECPTCRGRRYLWLDGGKGSQSLVLCGRNAVQVSLPDRTSIELNQLADRLKPLGTVTANRFLVRFQIDDFVITAFADGRAIINGTEDLAVAKRLYTQYIGS
jgi:adenylyltransferase/sulfurtransferase